LRWKDWAGYYAVCSYETTPDPEYFAFRHSAGLIDVTPLFKYEVTGPDAARFLARVMSRDIRKLKPGRVTYLCWCDDDGKVIDDGTVSRLGETHYRVTAAEPSLSWFARFARGYDVKIEDSTAAIGALSLQGPNARAILAEVVDFDIGALKFFGVMRGKLAGIDVWVSRTGYTGDLGYEIWTANAAAPQLYDAIMTAGRQHAIMPAGLDAMDVARIEAGFIMNGVDYFSAHHCMTRERQNSPFELGLEWTLELDREPFIGQEALKREKARGSERLFVGLDIDWVELENIFGEYDLPPEVPTRAWRDGKPVYDQSGEWIGQATSGAWSPTLKKNLALAQIRAPFAKPGTKVKIEATVEYHRHMVTATVVKPPFYNPSRKKA
jgi:aminomethyltransferase